MKYKSVTSGFLFGLMLSACVTINIYFPAAAAEDAARVIVRDVLNQEATEEAPKDSDEQTSLERARGVSYSVVETVLDLFISPAHAQADINISTPAISALRSSLKARAASLKPYYSNGTIGLTADGDMQLRDQSLVALKDRNKLKKLIAAENRERGALYAEIARSNDHPEWEADIRATFARVWVEEMAAGTWHQDASGTWRQK